MRLRSQEMGHGATLRGRRSERDDISMPRSGLPRFKRKAAIATESEREPESLESGAIRLGQKRIRSLRGRVTIRRWLGDGVGESATGQGRSQRTGWLLVSSLKCLKLVTRFPNDGSKLRHGPGIKRLRVVKLSGLIRIPTLKSDGVKGSLGTFLRHSAGPDGSGTVVFTDRFQRALRCARSLSGVRQSCVVHIKRGE